MCFCGWSLLRLLRLPWLVLQTVQTEKSIYNPDSRLFRLGPSTPHAVSWLPPELSQGSVVLETVSGDPVTIPYYILFILFILLIRLPINPATFCRAPSNHLQRTHLLSIHGLPQFFSCCQLRPQLYQFNVTNFNNFQTDKNPTSYSSFFRKFHPSSILSILPFRSNSGCHCSRAQRSPRTCDSSPSACWCLGRSMQPPARKPQWQETCL